MKFYVSSGNRQLVVAAKNPNLAVKRFLKIVTDGDGFNLGLLTKCSEQGFDIHEDDLIFDTMTMFEEIGFDTREFKVKEQ